MSPGYLCFPRCSKGVFAMRTLAEKGWRPSDALWPPRVARARTAPVGGGGARADDDGGDEGSEYQPFIGTR